MVHNVSQFKQNLNFWCGKNIPTVIVTPIAYVPAYVPDTCIYACNHLDGNDKGKRTSVHPP